MKSPFPGMDPYIEACGLWEEFHGHLIEEIYRAIATVLPRGYTVETSTRRYVVLLGADGKTSHLAKPDVAIPEPSGKKPRKMKGGVALAEPEVVDDSVQMQAFVVEEFKERFIEIHAEREERLLVTCIEVLSPSNKQPDTRGWEVYTRKREALLLGEANFLECDLVRSGTRMPMLSPWPASPYSLLLCRRSDSPYCRVWPAHFERRLPPIPVPLLASDPDLTLDLQPLIDGIYSLGRYAEQIDYTRPLTPPLTGDDAVRAHELLKARKRK